MSNSSNVILVDGDGIMLDYNKGFCQVYEKAFGVKLERVFPRYYTAVKEYGINMALHGSFENLYKQFHEAGVNVWTGMPELTGSVKAINSLVDKGYDVRCLTSMPPQFEQDRLLNLQTLGFKINTVYAVDRKVAKAQGIDNPKLKIIQETQALAFVDDLMKNFTDCEGVSTKLYWLDHEHPMEDNPNLGYNTDHVIRVSSMEEFANQFPIFKASTRLKI